MKRDQPSSEGEIPAYAFARGIRGKYAAARRESDATASPSSVQYVWAPLVEFPWHGSELQLTNDTWIRAESPLEVWSHDELADFLSNEDRDLCRGTRYWLHHVRPIHDELSANAAVNSFLLALWIVAPTATHVPLRFHRTDMERSVSRVLDRFQWIPGYACDKIALGDLEAVATLLPPLRERYLTGQRLRNALVLTFRGCVSVDWQSAFICFAAAAEALLTYSPEPGVTERLARAYAKVINASGSEVEVAIARFKRLYSLRSAIVHGRAYDQRGSDENLRGLAEFSEVLRTLWKIVLASDELRTQLELDDTARKQVLADV